MKSSKLMVYNKNIFSLLSLKYRVSGVERNTDDERYLVFFFNRNEDIENDFDFLQKTFRIKDLNKQLVNVNRYLLNVYDDKQSRLDSDECNDLIEDINCFLEDMEIKYKPD